ncbi:MAG TPA: RagB/SusD family nutrient uptake outer membrane protein [Flavitalea sp.]|nr:RagB/SusD family nutrient uptake outer membrane protein [Flavitalea sp.]
MRFIKITSLTLLLAVAISCNKKLDVKPQNELTPAQITTADDVKALVFGAYSNLQNGNTFGEKFNTLTELLFSDGELNFVGTFESYGDVIDKSQTANSGAVYSMWGGSYQAINGVNLAISKIDLIDEEERDQVLGEAEFIRALLYYELVNLFGKAYTDDPSSPGVPIILEPVAGYDPTRDKLPRATVQQVYDQVLSDANDALAKLGEESDDFRANKWAVLALLSRVYLSMEEYQQAGEAANEVIESGFFELTGSFDKEFNNASNSPEDIFAIQQTSQSNSGVTDDGITAFYSGDPVGRGEIQVSEDYIAGILADNPDDQRGLFFYEGSSLSGFTGQLTSKWRDLYKVIPIFRLAEMYLTRAEANKRAGNSALDDVNLVRERSGANPFTTEVSLDDIINERHLELAFEGEWFLTAKRLNLALDGAAVGVNDFLLFPIPQREIDLGNALPQNPEY